MGLQKCPLCLEEIQEGASRCKHCQADLLADAKKAAFKKDFQKLFKTGLGCGAIVLIIFFILIMMMMRSCDKYSSQTESTPALVEPIAENVPSTEQEIPGGEMLGHVCAIATEELPLIYSFHPPTPDKRYAYKDFDTWCDEVPPTFKEAFRKGKMTFLPSGMRGKALEYVKPLYKLQLEKSKKIWWVNENDLVQVD